MAEWLNPPNIYGTHLTQSYKKGNPLIKNITEQNDTQRKWHVAITLLVF